MRLLIKVVARTSTSIGKLHRHSASATFRILHCMGTIPVHLQGNHSDSQKGTIMYFLNSSGQNGGKTLFIFPVRKLLGKLCLEATLIFFQNTLAISWLDRWVCARVNYNTVVFMNSTKLYFVAQFNRKYKQPLFPVSDFLLTMSVMLQCN